MKIYSLNTQFDAHKSFYDKAKVIDFEDSNIELRSYDTPVAAFRNGELELYDYTSVTKNNKLSTTTERHIREFIKQFSPSPAAHLTALKSAHRIKFWG